MFSLVKLSRQTYFDNVNILYHYTCNSLCYTFVLKFWSNDFFQVMGMSATSVVCAQEKLTSIPHIWSMSAHTRICWYSLVPCARRAFTLRVCSDTTLTCSILMSCHSSVGAACAGLNSSARCRHTSGTAMWIQVVYHLLKKCSSLINSANKGIVGLSLKTI